MTKRKYKDALNELDNLSTNRRIKPWMHVTCLLKVTDCLVHLMQSSSVVVYKEQMEQVFELLYRVMNAKPKLVLNAANDIMGVGSRTLQATLLYDCAAHLYIKKGTKRRAWKGALNCITCLKEVANLLSNTKPSKFAQKNLKFILFKIYNASNAVNI